MSALATPANPQDLVREEWPLDPGVLHLNHGSYGAVPRSIRAKQYAIHRDADRNPTGFFRRVLDDQVEEARIAAAGFLNAQPDGVTLIRNVTEGVTAALDAIALRPGDEVLITDHQYGAVVMAVRHRCAADGARIKVATLPSDGAPDDVVTAITHAIDEKTRLLVIDHVASPHGLVLPIDRIVDAAHARGIAILVDAAHSPGMVEVDLSSHTPDFWVGNFHKWLCAPQGAGAFWVSEKWRQQTQPHVISFRFPRGFPGSFLRFGTDDLSPWLCIPEAITMNQRMGGVRAIAERNQTVALGARKILSETCALEPVEGPHESMAAVWLDQNFGDDDSAAHFQRRIAEELHAEVSINRVAGRTAMRVSAYLYNAPDDYQRLAEKFTDFR